MNEFESIVQGVLGQYDGRIITEVDPKTGNKTFKVKFSDGIPARARHIAATAINDLRHALDQAVCAVVGILTHNNDPGLFYFPIANNPADLKGRASKFPADIRDTLMAFQTYPTGNAYTGGNDLICALSKAAQRKHRISCHVGAKVTSVNYRRLQINSGVGEFSFSPFPEWDTFENELILCRTGPDGQLDYDVDLSLYVAFYDAGPFTGEPVTPIVSDLASAVWGIVCTLEAETARIIRKRAT